MSGEEHLWDMIIMPGLNQLVTEAESITIGKPDINHDQTVLARDQKSRRLSNRAGLIHFIWTQASPHHEASIERIINQENFHQWPYRKFASSSAFDVL